MCSLPVFAAGVTLCFAGLASSAFGTIISIPVDIRTSTGSSATQSSDLNASLYGANNAIDGNLGNFTHTNPPEPGNANGWWMVNLGTDRSFSTIRLNNRADCCGARLRDLTVTVLNASNAVIFTQSGINAGGSLGSPSFIDVNLGSVLSAARFIRVERTPYDASGSHDAAALSLAEVAVTNVSNVLLPSGTNLTHANIQGMAVSQSTTNGSFSASAAVDGIATNFTHTLGSDTSPSWTVDFGEVMNLSNFIITNRGDGCCQERLRDITVTVKNGAGTSIFSTSLLNPENVLGGPGSLSGSFPGGLQGRYVTISRTVDPDHSGAGSSANQDDANVLAMGEVNIFGSSVPEPSTALLASAACAVFLRRRRTA